MGLERASLESELGRKSTNLRARQRGRAYLERADDALQRTPRRGLRSKESAQRGPGSDRRFGPLRVIEAERKAGSEAGATREHAGGTPARSKAFSGAQADRRAPRRAPAAGYRCTVARSCECGAGCCPRSANGSSAAARAEPSGRPAAARAASAAVRAPVDSPASARPGGTALGHSPAGTRHDDLRIARAAERAAR